MTVLGEICGLAKAMGIQPVVPPQCNRSKTWYYDTRKYKQCNEIERLFRRLKGRRRICTRYDKLDIVFTFFIMLALIAEALK